MRCSDFNFSREASGLAKGGTKRDVLKKLGENSFEYLLWAFYYDPTD
jgi:hypothetical protein